jgi:NRPS condensation-like uncharacterized protein
MPGRLNVFQKSMLQWNDLHPYNAVHVVRLPGALDFARLQRVIAATLERHGLDGLVLARRAGTLDYGGGAPLEIRLPTAEAGPSASLAGEIERQLNSPFACQERFCPFRFFAVPERDSFSLGLVYFHAVADAECILMLLKDMVGAYHGTGEAELAKPVERYPRNGDAFLWRHPGLLARKLGAFPSHLRALRRARRPDYRDPADFNNGFVFFTLGPQVLGGLVRAAKTLGVTLNDLFLALLMKSVALVAPEPSAAERRREIALGCIVNARKDLGLEGRRVFGLFLGSFTVHHEAPASGSVADFARAIGSQTRRIKQKRLYLGAALELAFGLLMTPLYSVSRRRKLYQKFYPLWGGLTNMNLNRAWPQHEGSGPLDYFRAVSTGPATPLVLSITTIGQVANVGLSYRSTVFSTAAIERIKACFLNPPGLGANPS